MTIEKGNSVSIKHYSNENFKLGTILNTKDDVFIIQVTKPLQVYNFFTNDPMAITYTTGNNTEICEGTISEVNYSNNTFEFNVDKTHSLNNKRNYKRISTSLYAIIKKQDLNSSGYISNISNTGCNFKSRQNYDINSTILIRTSICDRPINLESEVIWKTIHKSTFEYGVKFKNAEDIFYKLLDQLYFNMINPLGTNATDYTTGV